MTRHSCRPPAKRSSAALLLLVVPLLTGGCRPEPLAQAVRFAAAMPGGELGERLRGDTLAEVVRVALARGEIACALRAARTITSWQRGSALADIAAELARRDDAPRAIALLAEAETVRRRVAAEEIDGTLGWCAERIAQHQAVATALLGEPHTARALLAGALRDADAAVVRSLATVCGATADPAAWQRLADTLATNRDFAVQSGLGEAWLLRGAASSPPCDPDALVAGVTHTLIDQPPAAQVPVRCRLAQWLQAHGRAAQAEEQWRHAGELARQLPEGQGRVVALGCVASSWHPAAGDPAASLLAEAQAALGRCAPLAKPLAGAALAQALQACGREQEAQRAFAAAFAEAAALENPGPRQDRCARVCLSLAECGLQPAPLLRRAISRQARAAERQHR